MYSQRLQNILTKLRVNPLDPVWTGHLLKLRHDVAKAFLTAPLDKLETLYKGDLGEAHGTLLSRGIAGYPSQPYDQQIIASIVRQVSQGQMDAGAATKILALMLYKGPQTLLPDRILPLIPAWLLKDFLKYSLSAPWLFCEKGEVELHYQHLSRWIDYLHTNVLGNPDSAYWHEVLLRGFLPYTSYTPLYFSGHNLKEISKKRSELIEFALELQGYRLDQEFGPRMPESRRIRFGVLAPHFAPGSETFATLPVYSQLDRQAFEIILLAPITRKKHALEDYCASYADRLVEIPHTDIPSSVEIIRSLDLDILWIGANITSSADPFVGFGAHRLARLQLTGGCSPATTGLRNMDVFVSGKLTEPVHDAQDHYSEQLICLDGPAHCFDFGPRDDQMPSQVYDRANLNIPESAVVYASGANFFKITPELEEVWIRILAAVPESRLLLYPFNPNWMSSYPAGPFIYRMSTTCKRLGVAGNRLVIRPPLPTIADVRAMLGVADVYLDSFPHSGMTSLIDPLMVGVPTVVLEGDSQHSRMASAALRDMDMTQLITHSQESYIQLAVRLGRDMNLRQQYSQQIRQGLTKPPKFLDPGWYGAEMNRLLTQLIHQSQHAGLATAAK